MRASLKAVAVLLAVALAGSPVVLDLCVTSCAAQAAGMTSSAPTCHHINVATERMTPTPKPCGHDHSGTVTMSSADGNQFAQPTTPIVALGVHPFASKLQLATRFNDAAPSPPPRTSLSVLAVRLRV